MFTSLCFYCIAFKIVILYMKHSQYETDCGKYILSIFKSMHLRPASYDHATDLITTKRKNCKYPSVQYSNNIFRKK